MLHAYVPCLSSPPLYSLCSNTFCRIYNWKDKQQWNSWLFNIHIWSGPGLITSLSGMFLLLNPFQPYFHCFNFSSTVHVLFSNRFPIWFFFLPSASPSPVFPTYSCQLTGSNIQLNCSLLAKTLSVSLYNWWHLVMESRQCALRNPIQHFGHMCILIILLKRELITFIRFSKKKLRIIGI